MSWRDILKVDKGTELFIRRFADDVEKFLNNHLYDEEDYTEEKIKEMQRSIDDGNSLDGMGELLDINLELDPDEKAGGLYVNVRHKNGDHIVYYQMDIDGNFRTEGTGF